MPDTGPAIDPHITVRECVAQQQRCQEGIRKEISSGLEGYTSRIETAAIEQRKTVDKMLVKVAEVDGRARANMHRLNKLDKVIIGVAIVVLAGAIAGGIAAWKSFGG